MRFLKLNPLWGGLCVASLVVWAGFGGTSCGTTHQRAVVRLPQIEGGSFVGNAACSDCHTNIVETFPASPHARFHLAEANHSGESGCESCHGAGSLHVKAGGGKGVFIHNPGNSPDSCLECHREIHAKFSLPNRHPVMEGQLNCVDCHDPHGRDIFKPSSSNGLAFARLNQNCSECHQEQARNFVFEHEAMREGCTECHDPHGSVNPKMLVQRDSNLCLKCHAQTQFAGSGDIFIGKEPHGFNMQAGGCWTAGCHTQVHGSMVDPKLRF